MSTSTVDPRHIAWAAVPGAPAIPAPRSPDDEPGHDSDPALVARLQSGDPGAFVTLFRRHTPMLHRLAARHMSAPGLAEDVVQETWLAVLEGVGRFEGRSSFTTWICTILLYTAQRHSGRQRKVLPFSDAFASRHTGDGKAGASEVFELLAARGPHRVLMVAALASDAGPAEAVVANEMRAALWELIDTLPSRHRTVIVLVDVEGRPPAEVCELLGLTPGNLRQLLHRARAHVRQMWLTHLDAIA